MRVTLPRRNVYDPVFMRSIKRTLNAYRSSMEQSDTKATSREAFVDIDERGPAWYLGHMQTATLALRDKVKDADFVLEIRDARLPFTTENPQLRRIVRGKPRLIIFNKAELANDDCNRAIQEHYESQGDFAMFTSAKRGWRDIVEAVQRLATHILPAQPYKTVAHVGLVVGMPNVGKSTLINALRLAHEYQFRREDFHRSRTPETVSCTPGTTRGMRLVPLSRDPNVVLYDSPGLTLPGCFSKEAGLKLAACGIVPVNNLTLTRAVVTRYLYDLLVASGSSEHLAECLQLPRAPISYDDCIAMICERSLWSATSRMGNMDPVRAQMHLLHDFRLGNLGKMTLDPLPRAFRRTLHASSSGGDDDGAVRFLLDGSGNTDTSSHDTASNDGNSKSNSSSSDRNADGEFVMTHEVQSSDVVDRYQDHMREVLQALQGKLHDDKCTTSTYSAAAGAAPAAARNTKGSAQWQQRRPQHRRSTATSSSNSTGEVDDDDDRTQTIISRKKGPISRATAYDESMRRNTRLAPGR